MLLHSGAPLTFRGLVGKAHTPGGRMGLRHPRHSLTRIHRLDADRGVTADGEAEAILPPRDGDLGHSPARLLPGADPRSGSPQAPPQSHPALSLEPERRLASLSPSLSRPRHPDHWVVGQAGKRGAQADAEAGMERAWGGQTSPSSAQLHAALPRRPTGPARLPLACDPLPARSLSPFQKQSPPGRCLPRQQEEEDRDTYTHTLKSKVTGQVPGSRGSPSPELEASNEGSQVRGQART